MTPLICKLLLGAVVPVDAAGIAMSTIQVIETLLGYKLCIDFSRLVSKFFFSSSCTLGGLGSYPDWYDDKQVFP